MMKQYYVPFCLLACMMIVLTGRAQVVIDQSNFPYVASMIDTFIIANPNGNQVPELGTGRVWDYSSITAQQLGTSILIDATNDPDLPNAKSRISEEANFQGFPVFRDRFSGVDANGYFQAGMEHFLSAYSLLLLTGSASDTIRFLPSKYALERFDYLQFPASYSQSWSQDYRLLTDFDLTIGAFALNRTPGRNVRIVTNSREVVGEGKLIIPTRGGNPSAAMDALLLKVVTRQVDSFYLAGGPAPQALMNAFGISQGMSQIDSVYLFYVPGFEFPALRITPPQSGAGIRFTYRPQSTDLVSSVEGSLPRVDTRPYPNPVQAGHTLQVEGLPAHASSLQLLDMQGRLVHSLPIPAGQHNRSLDLPGDLVPGLYFYAVQSRKGVTVSQGKLIIQ